MDYNKRNLLIKKRRRKRTIRRFIVFLVFFAGALYFSVYKLPFFNLSSVDVAENSKFSKEELMELSKVEYGQNIFTLKLSEIKANMLSNSYIDDVKINRVLPDKLLFTVKERTSFYYEQKDNKFYIYDKNGTVLEETDKSPEGNLINIDFGDNIEKKVNSKVSLPSERDFEILSQVSSLIERNTSDIVISKVDLTDFSNIKVFVGEMQMILGNAVNLKDKLNNAFNIYEGNGLKDKKGYIDVSSSENPVYLTQ